MDRNKTYRVYNKCRYAIGVTCADGRTKSIDPVTDMNPDGGFVLMTVDDILTTESLCRVNKFFAKRMLVPYDEHNVEASLEDLGLVPRTVDTKHLDDAEIEKMLKASNSKFEEWLNKITDVAELEAVYLVARDSSTLPKAKLDALKKKIPNKNWDADADVKE